MRHADTRIEAEKVVRLLTEGANPWTLRNVTITLDRMRGATLRELAEEWDLSRDRIRQIERNTIQRARRRLWERGVRGYFN